MTPTIVQGPNGRHYTLRDAGDVPVFVAEQPGTGSACGSPHSGHAVLVAHLDPVREGDLPLARVRLADGREFPVRADALCPADNLAARRILPRSAPRPAFVAAAPRPA